MTVNIGKPLSYNTRDNEQNKFCENSSGEVAVRVCGEVTTSEVFNSGTAGESISAVKAIYTDGTDIFLANNDDDVSNATVIGVTRTAATIGNNVKYQFDGDYFDSTLNFPVNDIIYLDTNGNLTNVAPTTGFITVVGKSLGPGAIRINIEEPIEIC